MRRAKLFGLAAATWLSLQAFAEPIQTLDLKSFAGPSPVESMGADWLVPRGSQVLDGVPFQMDGAILFLGSNPAQRGHPGRNNLTDIKTPARFEQLHLLCGSDASGTNGTVVAKVHLFYDDNTDAVLDLRYGENIGFWQGPWHKSEPPLQNTNARVVWTGQNSGAAKADKFLRLFHVILANPSPDKNVRSLSVESAGTPCGLLLFALSVGPASAAPLPDTLAAAKSPFPDLRERSGDPVQGSGFVKTIDGQPLAGAHLRVMATRALNTQDSESTGDDASVGTGAETDASGHFLLPPLPDNHLYRLLALADGFKPETYRGLDPKSDPIEIRLKPTKDSDNQGKFAIHGRVLGPDKKPLPYALVEPDGVGNNGGTSWGGNHNFPDQVVTDTNGEFTLAREAAFDRLQLRINSPGMAPVMIWVNPSNTVQSFELGPGGSLRGRVLQDGKPLAGVTMGISGQNRSSEVWVGHYETKTATNGVFEFRHLPPDTSWDLYGTMSSIKTYGALVPQMERSPANGETNDVGDLPVVPGKHLAGIVKTRHGEPLPKGMKVTIGYENAWDSQSVDVGDDGHFRFDGLAARAVDVSLNQRGWRLAQANRSMDTLNPFRLTGIIEEDRDDFVLMIEKGERNFNNYWNGNGQLPPQDQPQGRPLRGAEASGPPPIVLAGQVLDDKTGQPLLSYTVIPGYKPPGSGALPQPKPLLQNLLGPFARKTVPMGERVYWARQWSETISNAGFSLDYLPLTSQPVVRIEAPGYEPYESEPLPQTTTNLVIRLKHGVGPNGVVLLPNGRPAYGATLVFAADQEQFSMGGTSLNAYGNKDLLTSTPADGTFSFAARPEGNMLFVAHPAGWAQQTIKPNSADNLQIQLKPWADVTGTLVDSNGVPIAGTDLQITMFHNWQRGGAMVNLQERATTDAQGRFVFTNLPPVRLELQRLIKMATMGGYTYQMQTWFVAEPGITNDLGKVELDHPPPPPALDKIKDQLGL